MKGALAQGRGRFFGVGATSRPGLLPVLRAAPRQPHAGRGHRQGQPRRRRTRLGRRSPGTCWSADERGVVILSSRPQWKFSALQPLTAAERAEVLDEKPYTADPPLVPWGRRTPGAAPVSSVLVDGPMHLVTTGPAHPALADAGAGPAGPGAGQGPQPPPGWRHWPAPWPACWPRRPGRAAALRCTSWPRRPRCRPRTTRWKRAWPTHGQLSSANTVTGR
jgi:hypothetical protein